MSQLSITYVIKALIATTIFQHTIFAENIPSFFKNYERLITDLEIIYSRDGVSVNYTYNETTSSGLNSSPGCPKSITGLPWIYYGNPNRCYLAHQTGPCAKGEKLLAQNKSFYGICGCECMTLEPEKYSCLRQSNERYLSCIDYAGEVSYSFIHGQVYDTKEQKCYAKFEKGPCVKEGDIIASYTANALKCLPLCGFDDPLWYDKYKKEMCTTPGGGGSLADGISTENCKENYKYSKVLNKCVRQFTFKF